MDAHGMPVRIVITQGTRVDCTQADQLIEGISADHLIADRGYDMDAILELAATLGMKTIIPSKKNRTTQRPYDKWRIQEPTATVSV